MWPTRPRTKPEFGRPGSGRGEGRSGFPPAAGGGAGRVRHSRPVRPGHGRVLHRGKDARPRAAPLAFDGHAVARRPLLLQLRDVERSRATGAELLWRTKSNHILPVDARLADGSYLCHFRVDVTAGRPPSLCESSSTASTTPVGPRLEERYRLITTILAPETAPAADLAGLYPRAGSSRPPSTS